ncbi:MAG: thioredoxin fold domain-containing protein, partial [Campylobacteraceae bacterium]|nr:thioredoxin fold domain-containing protein [Campylobacteraceae bacterium]
ILALTTSLFASYNVGKKIFEKKCASCHTGYIAGKVLEDNFYKKDNKTLNLKFPTVNMIAYFLKDAPGHLGDKNDPEMQRVEIGDFVHDYVYNPNISNSVIPRQFLKYFVKKQSMKGKISEDELSNVVDYLFEYKKRRIKNIKQATLANMSINDLIKKAKKEHKLLLIEAISKTCYYCEKMKKEVLSLPEIKKEINKNYVFIQVDIDEKKLPLGLDKTYKKITPTFFALTPNGKLLNDYPGAWNKSDFLLILDENLKNKP